MGRLVSIIKKYWPLILIVVIGVILRLVKLEELFYFTYDESVPAFVGRRLILWHHVPLIGGVTPFGIHLGPYFYWFYAVLLWIGKLDPIIWGYASALFSAITIFLIFKVGEQLGTKKTAIAAAILWSFSLLAIIYDRHLWALFWGPIISLLTIFSLVKLIKRKNIWIYPLSLTVAIGIHADPSNLLYLGLSVISLIIFKVNSLKKNLATLFSLTILFLLPLIVFDLRHEFANLKPLGNFVARGQNNPSFQIEKFTKNYQIFPLTLSRLVYKFGDNETVKQYSYCQTFIEEKYKVVPFAMVIAATIIILSFIYISLVEKKPTPKLLSLTFLLYFVGIQIYGTIFKADVFEHYLTGLFPIFLLMTTLVITRLPKPVWLTLLTIFMFLNLYKLSQATDAIGLKNKKDAIAYTMQQVGDKPFSLDSLSTCWKYSGYRYLFAVYGREPVKSYVDPNFTYLYGTTHVAEKHPETVVAFVVHDFAPETSEFYKRYALLKSHKISSSLFGSIEVIILDNSTSWF